MSMDFEPMKAAINEVIEGAVEEATKEHMDGQPYDIVCSICGDPLMCMKKIDTDYDMLLTVEPCVVCLAAAKKEKGDEAT